jgi:tetratricopeptide (TPR) repeat protein
MLSRLTVLLLLLVNGLGAEASTLKGLVLAHSLGGPPVSNIPVSAPGVANPTTTGESGDFTLQFPGAQPGDVVQVTVNKPGYVVVNYVQLRVVLPKNPDAEPLTLLLCKEDQFEEYARQFYRLKSLDAVEQTYKAQVKKLKESNRQTVAAMAKLREERDQARASAEKAADEVARLKPGDTSDLYAQAMSLFLQGKVQDAIRVLDEEKLRKSIEAAEAKKTEAEREMAKAVQGYLLKATLLTTQFQFAEAEGVYESAIQAAPDDMNAHLGFARFSLDLNHFSTSRREYRQALEISQRNRDQASVATTLNELGVMDIIQNRREEARQHFEEALRIHRQLAQQNPDTSLPDVAATLNNLGSLDIMQNRREEGRQDYGEAVKVFRQLAKKNPDTYLPLVAATLNNLGNLDLHQNRMEEGRQDYGEAVKAFRQLAKRNPDTYLPLVAITLLNLGALDVAQNQAAAANGHFQEALSIFKELSKHDPVRYAAEMATIESALAKLGRSSANE